MTTDTETATRTVHCDTCRRRTEHRVTAYDLICRVCAGRIPLVWTPQR